MVHLTDYQKRKKLFRINNILNKQIKVSSRSIKKSIKPIETIISEVLPDAPCQFNIVTDNGLLGIEQQIKIQSEITSDPVKTAYAQKITSIDTFEDKSVKNKFELPYQKRNLVKYQNGKASFASLIEKQLSSVEILEKNKKIITNIQQKCGVTKSFENFEKNLTTKDFIEVHQAIKESKVQKEGLSAIIQSTIVLVDNDVVKKIEIDQDKFIEKLIPIGLMGKKRYC